MHMKQEWIEKIYAGWLAKIVGIRLGAPVESWTYEKIKAVYGALSGYPTSTAGLRRTTTATARCFSCGRSRTAASPRRR